MTPREQLKEAQARIYEAGGIVTLFADIDGETVPAQAIPFVDAQRGPEKSGTG